MHEDITRILSEFPVDGRTKPQRAAQLLPILQRVQRALGYVPPEAVPLIAKHLQLPASRVTGVATFYSQFRFAPAARNRVTVCRGTACHVRGSAKLLEEVSRALGIEPGQTAADLSFSLDTIACFGSCALAPVVVLNEKVHGRMNRSKLLKHVKTLSAKDEAARSEEAQS